MADLSVGGDVSRVGFVRQAVFQALFQLVHMLIHVADSSPGALHRPAHIHTHIIIRRGKTDCPCQET